MDLPNTLKGFGHWAGLGLAASIIALLVAYLFPGVIPARSAATRL